jgi:hypothetical protein
VVIKRLCCDDDSSIRSDCQWSNADYLKNNNLDESELPQVMITKGINKGKLHPRSNKGKLPAHVPEPLFLADPNHRRKGLSGELIKLDLAKKDVKFTMTRMDSTRITKNFGYMARTLKDHDESEFEGLGKAVLEHHFDNHIHCGSWCKRKDETEAQRRSGAKYYRSKETDNKLYVLLQEKCERFLSPERLKELAHSLDTNMNEAFNQVCTWFAPKNKVFAGTGSLHNRIAFAVGINSLGVDVFFRRLFKALCLPLSDNVAYYLKLREANRHKRLEKVKTREAKRHKTKRKRDKLVDDTRVAKMELRKRLGTYRRGMNLDGPVEDEEPPAKKLRASTASQYCEYCGKKGHVTRRSNACDAKHSTVKRFRKFDGSLLTDHPHIAPEEDEDAALAEVDCEAMDHMPFDASYNSEDDEDLAAFLLEDGALDDDDNDEGDEGDDDVRHSSKGIQRAAL